MTGPEAIDWVARITQEIEPLRRAWQPFASDLERASKAIAAARDRGEWRRLFEAWRQLSRAFVAARNSRDFQIRLRLMGWMVQQFLAAKDNPSHRIARVWLEVMHLTPQQLEKWLPYMFMDMPDLRISKRRGRRKGRPTAGTLKMVEQLDVRIKDTGELPTTAAMRLVRDLGFRGDVVKGKADHLVRVWRKRAFKSR